MGLRDSAGSALDNMLQQWIDTRLDNAGLVRRSELDAAVTQLNALTERLTSQRARLEGVQQAISALSEELDEELEIQLIDPELEERLDQLTAGQGTLAKRVVMTQNALNLATERAGAFEMELEALKGQASQAMQVATTARSIAESAADGVSELEDTLATK